MKFSVRIVLFLFLPTDRTTVPLISSLVLLCLLVGCLICLNLKEAMEKYIKDSLAAGIIRPSSSPLGAGFFFVAKKDKTLRPCIDFRGLNNITVKNKYPLPLLTSAFEPLQGATIFTKLDLRNAYHLVRIRDGDEWKTGFNTPLGHFEYLVMPFGLTNAPAVFQALVNDVLRDFLNRFVFVYLDDILIFSKSEHISHVRQVLQRLRENKLFAKAEKCEFHSSSVSFLGYVIESGQVKSEQWLNGHNPPPENSFRDSLALPISTDDSLKISAVLRHHLPDLPPLQFHSLGLLKLK